MSMISNLAEKLRWIADYEYQNRNSEVIIRQAADVIEMLSEKARIAEQLWIPCSERLPKKEEATYLICTEAGYMCSCRWTNHMYGLRSNEWSKWGWHIMDKPQYAKVVAWMPLKPWKGADDE